jgi:hypothetical protein
LHGQPQNTEDEVLKAAIAKYGKNQWYLLLVLLSVFRSEDRFRAQGSHLVVTREEDSKTMQSTVVRMARPLY